jgi:hypothetical protein
MCMMMLGLVGGAISAMGTMAAANAQAAALKAQGEQMKMEGGYALAKAGFEANRMGEQAQVDVGKATTAYSTAGLSIKSGTPDFKITYGLLAPAFMRSGVRITEGQHAYAMGQYGAKIKNMEAASVQQAGAIGAVSSLLGSFQSMIGSGNSGFQWGV